MAQEKREKQKGPEGTTKRQNERSYADARGEDGERDRRKKRRERRVWYRVSDKIHRCSNSFSLSSPIFPYILVLLYSRNVLARFFIGSSLIEFWLSPSLVKRCSSWQKGLCTRSFTSLSGSVRFFPTRFSGIPPLLTVE